MEQKKLSVFSERFHCLRIRSLNHRGEPMSQAEFAAYLGISRPTIGFYENGTRYPDAYVLNQIASKCHVSADWLLGLSDFMTHAQEAEKDELYNQLTELMEKELDAHDRERVARSLEIVIRGFIASQFGSYVHYENAVLRVGLAMTTVSESLEWVVSVADSALPQKDRDDIYHNLYKIVYDASSTAFKELGHFFSSSLDDIREALSAHEYMNTYQGFVIELEALKKKWNFIQKNVSSP